MRPTHFTAHGAAGAARASVHKFRIFLGVCAMTALATTLQPHPASSQGVQLVRVDVAVVGQGHRTKKLVGHTVVNEKNEKIGTIDDIIVGRDKSLFAVLQVGGFLGMGSRLVAIPYDTLTIDEANNKVVLPGATRDELKKLAEFKYIG